MFGFLFGFWVLVLFAWVWFCDWWVVVAYVGVFCGLVCVFVYLFWFALVTFLMRLDFCFWGGG